MYKLKVLQGSADTKTVLGGLIVRLLRTNFI